MPPKRTPAKAKSAAASSTTRSRRGNNSNNGNARSGNNESSGVDDDVEDNNNHNMNGEASDDDDDASQLAAAFMQEDEGGVAPPGARRSRTGRKAAGDHNKKTTKKRPLSQSDTETDDDEQPKRKKAKAAKAKKKQANEEDEEMDEDEIIEDEEDEEDDGDKKMPAQDVVMNGNSHHAHSSAAATAATTKRKKKAPPPQIAKLRMPSQQTPGRRSGTARMDNRTAKMASRKQAAAAASRGGTQEDDEENDTEMIRQPPARGGGARNTAAATTNRRLQLATTTTAKAHATTTAKTKKQTQTTNNNRVRQQQRQQQERAEDEEDGGVGGTFRAAVAATMQQEWDWKHAVESTWGWIVIFLALQMAVTMLFDQHPMRATVNYVHQGLVRTLSRSQQPRPTPGEPIIVVDEAADERTTTMRLNQIMDQERARVEQEKAWTVSLLQFENQLRYHQQVQKLETKAANQKAGAARLQQQRQKELAHAVAGLGPLAEQVEPTIRRMRDHDDSTAAASSSTESTLLQPILESQAKLTEIRDQLRVILSGEDGSSDEAREALQNELSEHDASHWLLDVSSGLGWEDPSPQVATAAADDGGGGCDERDLEMASETATKVLRQKELRYKLVEILEDDMMEMYGYGDEAMTEQWSQWIRDTSKARVVAGSSSKEHTNTATGGGVATTSLQHGDDVSQIHSTIAQRLEIELADGTGRVDYAAIHHGSSVIRSGRRRTSPSLIDSLPVFNRILSKLNLRFYGYGPEAALIPTSPPLALGQCWSFPPEAQSEGFATLSIRLARPIYVESVMIEHPSLEVSDKFETAIKDFKITGFEDDKAAGFGWPLLQKGQYRKGISRFRQEFKIQDSFNGTPIPKLASISIAIQSNWGGQFACLYRLRVHGRQQADDDEEQPHHVGGTSGTSGGESGQHRAYDDIMEGVPPGGGEEEDSNPTDTAKASDEEFMEDVDMPQHQDQATEGQDPSFDGDAHNADEVVDDDQLPGAPDSGADQEKLDDNDEEYGEFVDDDGDGDYEYDD